MEFIELGFDPSKDVLNYYRSGLIEFLFTLANGDSDYFSIPNI